MNMEIFGVLIAGLLTLAIYSFLYKDNPVYKFAEHIFVGVTAGYTVCIAWYNVIEPNLKDELWINHNIWVLIPAFFGVLMFTRFVPKISWISRISIAFVIAVAAGISVPNQMQATVLKHTYATIQPFIATDGFHLKEINNLIVIVGVATVLIYFFFSIEQGKGLKVASRTGIIFIMIGFGASFGYTVMGRISLVIDRVWFLLKDWGPTVLHLFR